MDLKESNCNSNDMKPPLKGKTIYLDLKMYPGKAKLSETLKLLGAKLAPVFDRNVSCVVTNRESARNAPVAQFKIPPKNWTPLTPITNTTCHSPQFFSESSVDYMDSPSYTNSPATDQNVSMCRGMAMVKQAISKKQGKGTTDLIESCRQWNVKVKYVDQFVLQVDKLKSRYKTQLVVEKKRKEKGEKKLRPPFLKVEESKSGGTWYKEFLPSTFNNKLADQVKELYNHFKKSGNIQVTIKPTQGEFSKNKCFTNFPIAQSTAFNQSLSKSVSKFSETAKPSTAFSFCNMKRKVSEHAPFASKKQKISQRKKKTPYCEICNLYYVHLDEHLASKNHRNYMSDPINFLEVQNIVSSLPKKEDFLLSGTTLLFDLGQASGKALVHSSHNLKPLDNLLDHPQEHPKTCGLSAELDNEFNSQDFNLSGIVSAVIEDLNTEQYSVPDQLYVSPSCSSPESAYLPFLEDSFDKITYKSDISDMPLNLSNDENRNFLNKLSGSCNQGTNLASSDKTLSAIKTLPTNALTESVHLHSVSVLNGNTSITDNIQTVSNTTLHVFLNERKREEEYLNCIPLSKNLNALNKVETNASQEIFSVVEHGEKHRTSSFQCIDCTQEKSLHCSQLEIVNPALLEDKALENLSHKEKIQNISNDSGISIRDSPPLTLTCVSFGEEVNATSLKVVECCALDLSTTKGLVVNECSVSNEILTSIETKESKCNSYDQQSAVPEMLDAISPDQLCETSEHIGTPNILHGSDRVASSQNTSQSNNFVCDPIPTEIQNKPTICSNYLSKANAVDIENVEHLETSNILHESKHEASIQNADPPTGITLEQVPVEVKNQLISSSKVSEADAIDIENFDASKLHEATVINIVESGGIETSNVLHKIKQETDTQNSGLSIDIASEQISTEYKNIQAETICFENSSCLDKSNVLDDCKYEDSIHNSQSAASPTDEPINVDHENLHEKSICSSNMVKGEFFNLCHEVSKSFNCIDDDLHSSAISVYELVDEADCASDSGSEWVYIHHREVDKLCIENEPCAENEDTDPFTICC